MNYFKDIPRYKGRYAINNSGTIRRNKRVIKQNSSKGNLYTRVIKEKYLKPIINPSGYLTIKLTTEEGVSKTEFIHKLVAETFLENKHNKKEVNHIDHNKLNNHVSNLEYVTRQENMKKYYEFSGIERKKFYCKKCHKEISRHSLHCIKCNKRVRKNLYEKLGKNKEDLIKEISKVQNFEKLGRKYKVTGNAVKKWCKKFGIPDTIEHYL